MISGVKFKTRDDILALIIDDSISYKT